MNEHGTTHLPAHTNAPLVSFVVGAAVGAGIALLLAPASGSETRRRIRDGVDRARHSLSGLKHDVQAAVASGRESFVREREARSSSTDAKQPV